MGLMDNLKDRLPSLLKSFDMKECHVFFEDDVLYMIIKREKNLPIYMWHYFEDILKITCEINKFHIISYGELEPSLRKDLVEKSILIKGGKVNE